VRKFVLTWHIDETGPDWQDNYLLYNVYERDRGILYDPYKYPKAKDAVFVLHDDLIPLLLAKLRELIAQHAEKLDRNPKLAYDHEEDPEIQFQHWWLKHIR